MARGKGMGSLQLEKSGRWTLRVGLNGKRFSRSTGLYDRAAAERFAQRFLSPLGLGERRLPLAEVWFEYERSPNRRDLAPATLRAKRQVWMAFAKWMERGHPEVSALGQLTSEMVGEYLRCLRIGHGATTYNNNVCVLREICRTLYDKAGMIDDPWEGVRLLADDAHSRREFTVAELERILEAARKMDGERGENGENGERGENGENGEKGEKGERVKGEGVKGKRVSGEGVKGERSGEWELLFLVGIYTGLRLGDCCTLEWNSINLERKIIQVIPRKTRKHAHGRPVTIPIHPVLFSALATSQTPQTSQTFQTFVLPQLAEWYKKSQWHVSEGLKRIFKAANIVTSVRVEGRRYKAPEATFHSLRHTFVSLAANAGVPLPVVQSIVGHTSTAMTRHYYHETEAELWRAVGAIPEIGRAVRREIRLAVRSSLSFVASNG